jgi:DNA-binding PucR family transcriptional regulator
MTHQSVRANLGLIVTMLREGRPPASAAAPEEALAYVREYVRRGLGLELLQRAYRTAQAALSRQVLARLHATTGDAESLVEAVGFFNDWLFAWVEALERQLTAVYMHEREQWVRGAAAVRSAEVRALLEGARSDVAQRGRRLGYELDRRHVAFVVWSDEADGDGQALFGAMERLAGAVADALGARSSLVVPQGRHLACWAALRTEPAPSWSRDLRPGPGLRVTVGSSAAGVEGFCASHREALLAGRVARLSRGGTRCTLFADIALDALATHDVDEAQRFVERELGSLASDDDAARRMSATLRVFLEEGSSYVRAARRLGVHQNTVLYRVHRAEELLGRRIAERELELRVALRLARLTTSPSG